MFRSSSSPPKRSAFTKVEVLIALIVIGVAIAIIVPAVQKVREAAARTQSTNNLKLIGLAMHSFHDAHRRLPFNGSDKYPANSTRKYNAEAVLNDPCSGSWAFQLIPYSISLMDLYPNVRELGFDYLMCPGRGRPDREDGKGGWSDYVVNNYLNDPENAERPDNADAKRTLESITDGTANTIFLGHGNISTRDYKKISGVIGSTNIFLGGTFGTARAGPNWGSGKTPSVTLQRDSEEPPDLAAGGWGGPFPQGGLMCMGDATIRMFPCTMSGDTFGAFLTPTGGEKVELPDN